MDDVGTPEQEAKNGTQVQKAKSKVPQERRISASRTCPARCRAVGRSLPPATWLSEPERAVPEARQSLPKPGEPASVKKVFDPEVAFEMLQFVVFGRNQCDVDAGQGEVLTELVSIVTDPATT